MTRATPPAFAPQPNSSLAAAEGEPTWASYDSAIGEGSRRPSLGVERRPERAASLAVFSGERREDAAPLGAERERLRECGERPGKWGERRGKRVGRRSVRVGRPTESSAALFFVRRAARRARRAAAVLKGGGSRNRRGGSTNGRGGSPSSEGSAASGVSGSARRSRGRARSESVARFLRRLSESGKRRPIAHGRTLHECAKPLCEGVGRLQAFVGRPSSKLATLSAFPGRLQAESGRRCEVAARIPVESRERRAGARELEVHHGRLEVEAGRPGLPPGAPRGESERRARRGASVRAEKGPLDPRGEPPAPRTEGARASTSRRGADRKTRGGRVAGDSRSSRSR